MQLDTAIEEVRARLQELSADFWTAAEVLRAIQEGVNRFAQEEKWPWLFTSATAVALTANTATLDLVTGVAWERHFDLLVTFSGDSRPRLPRRVSPAEGTELRTRYYTNSSEPLAYYIFSEANSGASGVTSGSYKPKIKFVPAMNRAAVIEYTYVRDPVEASGTLHLDMPDEYVMGALAYATGHLFLKELSTSQKAGEQFDLYRKVVDDARKQLRKLTMDSGVAMGRNEPEPGVITESDWVELVTPTILGP